MSVNGTNSSSSAFAQVPASGPLAGTTIQYPAALYQNKLGSGTAADQVDTPYLNTGVSIPTGSPLTLDLTSLTDPLGNAISFARVRRVRVRYRNTVDGDTLVIGNSGTNEWDAILSAGGTMTLQASTATNAAWVEFNAPNSTGYAVDSTHKTLKLAATGHAATVDIEILGASV